jgi:hypothetical protein
MIDRSHCMKVILDYCLPAVTTGGTPYCKLFGGTSFQFYESQPTGDLFVYRYRTVVQGEKINSYSDLISSRRKLTGKDSH